MAGRVWVERSDGSGSDSGSSLERDEMAAMVRRRQNMRLNRYRGRDRSDCFMILVVVDMIYLSFLCILYVCFESKPNRANICLSLSLFPPLTFYYYNNIITSHHILAVISYSILLQQQQQPPPPLLLLDLLFCHGFLACCCCCCCVCVCVCFCCFTTPSRSVATSSPPNHSVSTPISTSSSSRPASAPVYLPPEPCRFRFHHFSDRAEALEAWLPVQCHVRWYVSCLSFSPLLSSFPSSSPLSSS